MPVTEESAKAALQPQAAQAWTRLESRVEGVKQRHRFKFLGTGVCLALAVFAAAFLGFSIADIVFKLAVSTRVLALLSTLFAIGAVFYSYVIRPWSRMGGTLQVARNVEVAYPELEQQLSTALEYGRNPDLGTKTSSPELVGALMQQAANRAEPLDFSRTISWRSLGIAALLAFVLALGFAGYALKENRLFQITFARFLKPTADIPVPTLTVIKSVSPGDDAAKKEVPVEFSVPVSVEIDGRAPETATLSVFIPDEKGGRWEDRVMDRDKDGQYKATLRRLLDNTRYKVRVNDAESPEYTIEVYKIPEITDFALRLEHPPYTGKGIETLAPGVGDVRALKGTIVHVDMKANTDLSTAKVSFKSGKGEMNATIDQADKRKATLTFQVDGDDQYQMHVANSRNKTGSGSPYTIKAVKDFAPRVLIKKPEKDLMVHRDQTVTVEISADDDIGVREVGIFHSLGLEEAKVMVRRLDPATTRAEGKLVWELGNLGLKGGEVISYYAYALDNDTLTGPKIAKSDIHFLTVYDEEDYDSPKSPKKPQQQGTPPAVKQLDKLIDIQKKLLKETFAQARQREAAMPQPVSEAEKGAAAKTADGQKKLRAQVEELVEKVKQELAEGPPPENTVAPDGPRPQQSGLGEKEIKHMESAAEKMGFAETKLKEPDTVSAVRPENEALRHLSETRRLLLSDKEGDPRFKMAMDKQSKKKKQQEQNQQQQDQQQAKEELAQMPKMMERQKNIERELEELELRKKKNPPPPPGQAMNEQQKKEQEEQRRLQREQQQELEKLAKEAEERARKLEELAARNPDMQPAADKMQQAADKMKKAAEEAKQQAERNLNEAKEQTQQANKDTKDSQRSLRNALEKQVRQELANLQKDAQELAQRQQDLAEQAKQQNEQQKNEQGQPQQGKPEQGQPQQGQPQQGQPQQGQPQQGQPQQGQPQQGQPQQGQPQQGQPQQGQPQQGQPQQGQQGKPESGQPQNQQGQPGQQGQPKNTTPEQRMRAMAGQQRDIKNELKELGERLEKVASQAQEKGLAGANELEQAKAQSNENSPASKSADAAQSAMQSAKSEEAQREAAQAAKALEQMASKIQEAAQKTSAGDMKQLAGAMKKLQAAAKEQGDINKEMADKKDASSLGDRQEKVGEAAKELADGAEKMEVLRQNGRQNTTKEKLDEAAKQASNAARAMKTQDAAAAKSPAENAEKALSQALSEMERAAGKTLEEKAREAKAIAKAARENQEKAAETAKDVAQPKADEKLDQANAAKRDEAAAKERSAARDAKRLENALEGLQELAKDANPAAADAAREAREETQQAELPKSMENLAKSIEKIGDPKKAADKDTEKLSPQEASQKGDKLAETVRKIEKNLDNYITEAKGAELDRLKAMEAAAREAAKKAQDLAQNNPEAKKDDTQKSDQPNKNEPSKDPAQQNNPSQQTADSKNGDPKDSKNPQSKPSDKPGEQQADALKQLEKEMKRLQPKLERLEPNAPELKKMKEAMAQLKQAQEKTSQKSDSNGPPTPGPNNTGGENMKRVSKELDEVAGGLVNRIERILRAREIKPDEDEGAPNEYRVLVDKYYRALSEDVEEEKR